MVIYVNSAVDILALIGKVQGQQKTQFRVFLFRWFFGPLTRMGHQSVTTTGHQSAEPDAFGARRSPRKSIFGPRAEPDKPASEGKSRR